MVSKRSSEYRQLLDLYVRSTQSMAGSEFRGSKAWIVESEYLTLKLFYHLASLLYLHPGTHFTNLGGIDVHVFDFPSAAVLCRASFETYLTFNYIFIATCSDEERRLRYLTWSLGGLLDRQKATPRTNATRQRLDEEEEQIRELHGQIEENQAFAALPPKRQKEARKGQWRFDKSWADLAAMAGKDRAYFAGLYTYLSSYAHTGYLSALQIGQAQDKQDQYQLSAMYIDVGLTIMSHFLTDYAALFPPVAEVINSSPEDKRLLELWHGVGSSMGRLYEPGSQADESETVNGGA
jgi:AraC-like DNA-binding protein